LPSRLDSANFSSATPTEKIRHPHTHRTSRSIQIQSQRNIFHFPLEEFLVLKDPISVIRALVLLFVMLVVPFSCFPNFRAKWPFLLLRLNTLPSRNLSVMSFLFLTSLPNFNVFFPTHQALLSCSLFEDNSGTLALALDHKTRPCTKNIGLKYHHFCLHVTLVLIKLFPISTFDQMANIFTIPLPSVPFIYLRQKLLGS
jgi:hypothetical protein